LPVEKYSIANISDITLKKGTWSARNECYLP